MVPYSANPFQRRVADATTRATESLGPHVQANNTTKPGPDRSVKPNGVALWKLNLQNAASRAAHAQRVAEGTDDAAALDAATLYHEDLAPGNKS